MPIQYQPQDAVLCWPEGEYEAVLEKVEDKTSKAGNPMQVWTLKVFNADGRSQTVTEYVVIPSATFKIKQLARALGRGADFDAGRFQADDYLNSNVIVRLTIEEQDGFDDKNRVQGYKPLTRTTPAGAGTLEKARAAMGKPAPQPAAAAVGDHKELTDADIPFESARATQR